MERQLQHFYSILLAGPTVHRLAKFDRVQFADLRLRNLSNEVECKIYGGWVETTVQFQAVSGPKFMSF